MRDVQDGVRGLQMSGHGLQKSRTIRFIPRIGRKDSSLSDGTCSGCHSKTITTLIFRMPGMTFYPVKSDPMLLIDRKKSHP